MPYPTPQPAISGPGHAGRHRTATRRMPSTIPGQVVGYGSPGSGNAGPHALPLQRRLHAGAAHLSRTLSAVAGSLWPMVNNSAQIVGDYDNSGSSARRVPLLQRRHADLGTLGGNLYAWQGTMPAINASGQVVGYAITPARARYLRSSTARVGTDARTLGSLGVRRPAAMPTASTIGPDRRLLSPHAIPAPTRPSLQQRLRLIDLNSLIPAGSGWTLYDAQGINDSPK